MSARPYPIMISTILDALLPVAVAMCLGWLAGRLRVLAHDDARVLAVFVIRFALPLALFEGAVETTPSKLENIPLVVTLAVGLMGIFLLALMVGKFAFRHDLKTASNQALVCAFPDMAYFGAPILLAVFGPAGFIPVLLGNLVTSLLMLPLTIVLIQVADTSSAANGTRGIASIFLHSIGAAVTNPMVWLPVSGAILSFLHVHLPHPVMASVSMVAKSAGGTSLFALGLMLYGEPFRINANVAVNLLLKNFAQPVVMGVAALTSGLGGAPAHQAIITGAVPTATAAAMFALKSKTYTADATATILISTILGIVTEAAIIAFLR
ncbi:hypothetical protein HDG32_001080 [Paraburkholderia sp. CI2]|uniref:AEC family transporter n=1 Tax=Paraburkholderia sp. CI2 TaxID=2723093 RepID=UPI0017D75003|nr:AEC family transporter [Paraburkholderia sp. CI2]MBB5464986.1 hypothetical protein [Paraburkholderia sp. CI2]